MPGRLLPAFPQRRALPWVLAAISIGALVYGVISSDESALVGGSIGLAGVVVGYPLAALIAGREPGSDAD